LSNHRNALLAPITTPNKSIGENRPSVELMKFATFLVVAQSITLEEKGYLI